MWTRGWGFDESDEKSWTWRSARSNVTLSWSYFLWSYSSGNWICGTRRDYPSLTVYWESFPAGLHRLDGPAIMFSERVALKEADRLSCVKDPGTLDGWFRDHQAGCMEWYVHDCLIYRMTGHLTEQFPEITTELIRSNIEIDPHGWLRVAREFNLMDDGLRELSRVLGLVSYI